MIFFNTIDSVISIIAGLISICSAVYAGVSKRNIRNLKKKIGQILNISDFSKLETEANEIRDTIIKYKMNNLRGRDKKRDMEKILTFISNIKTYSSLLQKDIVDEYFEKMTPASSNKDYNEMYLLHSTLIEKIQSTKRKLLYEDE